MYYQIIIDDRSKQAKAALGLLRTIEGVSISTIPAGDSLHTAEKEFVKQLEDGLEEVKEIKAGRKKAKSLQDLLNEN